MKTKFITIEGYGEIKSTRKPNNPKKLTLSKKVKKFFKICYTILRDSTQERKAEKTKVYGNSKHYANSRKNSCRNISKTAVTLSKSPRNFLKGKVALGVATSFVAVFLCVMTSMSVIPLEAYAVEEQPDTSTEIKAVSVNNSEFSKDIQKNITTSMCDEILTSGYGLYVDNELVGVTTDKKGLKESLQNCLDGYKAKYDSGTTDKFANSVKIVSGSYKSSDIQDAETVVEENEDKFSYSLSTDIVYTQKTPYTTKYKYNKSKFTTYKKVTKKGVYGKQNVTYRVTYVDGLQTDVETKSVKTIQKPKKQVVVVGTKKPNVASSVGTGSFMWPVPYTRNITSGYGSRWGRFHSGIDIAAAGSYGKSIVASDAGTVIWAGYDSSGYGNYVIIDHGNGYSTLYGHCSSLAVRRGQVVAKGQTISYIGSTGDSTGPHLHFEVRKNGSRLNPLNYV
ncbi:MAG: peptidoglycan DD-metalloendopeptidase family protein [Oscillospiraceae bacterium]|nr:peptidoglycan DD-metalloendopeptidase family protein [Oscillospiraceae bacterium]